MSARSHKPQAFEPRRRSSPRGKAGGTAASPSAVDSLSNLGLAPRPFAGGVPEPRVPGLQIDVPPVLGYGAKGLPKRGVPPDARLTYDVELLAINALSTP